MAVIRKSGTKLEGSISNEGQEGRELSGNNDGSLSLLMDANDKVIKELFERAEMKDGLPCISANKTNDVLKANGFKSAINPQSP